MCDFYAKHIIKQSVAISKTKRSQSRNTAILKGKHKVGEGCIRVERSRQMVCYEVILCKIGQKLRKLKMFKDFKIIIKCPAILNI